ncbi:MAG: hypothetical protein PHD33_07265 [Atribacterota bacterium]|nr:hypothetical protein [Atribacterota bacterium]
MKRSIKLMSLAVVLFVAMFLLAGCFEVTEDWAGKITGGGWFLDCVEGEETKCTFGFVAQGKVVEDYCGDWWDVYEFKGQFQFNDHISTKVHAPVEGLLKVYQCFGMFCDLTGYEFDGMTKDGLPVSIRVNEDGTEIQIGYDGAVWEGLLEGGNITIH